MAFCDNCGHELRSKSKFCGSCGEPTELIEDTPKTHRSKPIPSKYNSAKIAIGVVIPVMVIIGIYFGLQLYDDTVEKIEQQERKMEQQEREEKAAIEREQEYLSDYSRVCNFVVAKMRVQNDWTGDEQLDFLEKCPENLTQYGWADINDPLWCSVVKYCPNP